MMKDTSNRGPEGRSRVIPKCVYNIEKVISPGNCDSTLNTNRQNIGLDTEYNSNWDSPELFPSVHVIAFDDEGITPLTEDWKVKAE